MEASSNAHKRQRLGFEKYSNSKVLSGITIRYGDAGELKFEAHRLLLSAKSHWFEAAFTGGFSENNNKEITLAGDDPDALKIMLDFAYTQEIHPPEGSLHGEIFTIDYFLELYRVGDKYQFPAFIVRIVSWLRGCMHAWLNKSGGPFGEDRIARFRFCSLVREIYELVGSEYRPSHPLVQVLLGLADDQGSTGILNNTGGNQPLIVLASEKTAEFGRDILLHLMKKTGPLEPDDNGEVVTAGLCIRAKVICSFCGQIWWNTVICGQKEELQCSECEVQFTHWVEKDGDWQE
ncbi:hypothetical protein G6011_02573 [Alternaria panax]|uniref:BTB domain-containing protein n=1 Tax=Alternaria panax TaxID=48097 RepID=A0AAD4FA54_9PLEO|nr:hypothetical protein G6011_02573 [Alternaria panax]